MTILDWVLGVLFRPAATFAFARNHMRFSYWWILLSVFTLELVVMIYSPANQRVDSGTVFFFGVTTLMILFDLYALLLFGTARSLKWALTWPEAVKLIGLTWSVRFLEDLVTFYPVLREMHSLILWLAIPFTIWHVVCLAAGVRKAYKLSTGHAVISALVAVLPMRLAEAWLYWSSIPKGS